MHVGMEEAVANGMPQEALDDRVGERVEIEAARLERRQVGERRAFDPVGGEHLPRGQRPVDLGHAEVRIIRRHCSPSPAMAAASMRRSISSLTDWASVSMASTGRSRRRSARAALDQPRGKEEDRRDRRAKRCSMPGRRILTATSRPSVRLARCTWAIEAAATGGPKIARTGLAAGAPRLAFRSSARASSIAKGGRRSCSVRSSGARLARRYRAASPGTARA